MLGSNKECRLLCVKPGLHGVIYGNIIVSKTMIEKETASLKLGVSKMGKYYPFSLLHHRI